MKTVLITAGGTVSPIDEVRCITNISTGKLASVIADEMIVQKNVSNVYYLHSRTAVLPSSQSSKLTLVEANTPDDVFSKMENLCKLYQFDVIVHAMAVSDFTFLPLTEKLKSNDPEVFIESLRKRIVKSPKIIDKIKTWCEHTILVGFKFEVGKTEEELIKIALESMQKTKADFTLANDKHMMNQARSHIGFLVKADGTFVKLQDKKNIAEMIANVTILE